ncbi:MAG: hypothetical protein K9W45_04675 [Candidatus Heimdallarchaeum aukensis]|uniref:Uncharacterized protein n=1 Tax=Candidatus Heimdallarchaeum aukensis TaxID=2876573 RepID=A0A9Y1BMG7_9ARCH|nr:MAG: hypothetical protein K9W45_04675 [Candidatus Heimdallarchaeum aukensis]
MQKMIAMDSGFVALLVIIVISGSLLIYDLFKFVITIKKEIARRKNVPEKN